MKKIEIEQKGKTYYTLVDDEDYDVFNSYTWYINAKGAVYCGDKSIRKYGSGLLHRLVLGLTSDNLDVDHKDGNKLNNQKENLRTCTRTQNQQNRGKTRASTTGYKGVTVYKGRFDDPSKYKFVSSVKVNGKRLHLGYFDSPIDAAHAYDIAAIQHYGEFAKLNFPLIDYLHGDYVKNMS